MQEGRPSMRVGSASGDRPRMAPEVSAATLKTSTSTYLAPLAPDRKKFSNHLVAIAVHVPQQQPLAPFAPPGVAISAPWLPFHVVPLPPKLVFETWWTEGQSRERMHVTFDTVTRQCLAGTNVTLGMTVTTLGGRPIDEYDLHVGAELRVAGRRVTLRKALTLGTLSWMDQQARAMLVAKFRLEEELNKFRPVVPVPGQYTDSQRVERFDLNTHQHLPAGGRLNLRALHNFVMGLVEQLRQHRMLLPRLPEAVSERLLSGRDRDGGPQEFALAASASPLPPPPPDWCPDRRERERLAAEARAREAALASAVFVDDTWRQDLLNWLRSIPLASSASSCCASYSPQSPPSASAAPAVDGKGLSSGGGAGGGGGRDGSGRGDRSLRSGSGGTPLSFNVNSNSGGGASGGAAMRLSSAASRTATMAPPLSPGVPVGGRQFGGTTSPRQLPPTSPPTGTRPGSLQRAGA